MKQQVSANCVSTFSKDLIPKEDLNLLTDFFALLLEWDLEAKQKQERNRQESKKLNELFDKKIGVSK